MAIDVRSGGVMPVQKQVRINPAGRIVDPDRQVHVRQEDGAGGVDKVRFRYVGKMGLVGACTIDFSRYLTKSPFGDTPGDITFSVPAGGKILTVDETKPPGVYKYDVRETANPANITDDPDVIVD